MNIIDALIIIVFIIGLLNGFRNGVIKSLVGLVGIILVVILAYTLKNPVAEVLYTTLPFFKFGIFKGVAVFNILFYEAVAFILVFSILLLILKIVLKVTGFVEKILDATVLLGIGSRLLGALVSLIETYIILFIVLFIINKPFFDIEGLENSKLNNFILNKTPILTNVVENQINAMDELFALKDIYENTQNIDEYNYKSLDILLKYNIITVDSVKILQSKDKLNFKNLNELIIKYGG